MALLLAGVIGIMVACSAYLLLRGESFPVVLGLTLLSYAANLFLFASGGLALGGAPIIGAPGAGEVDPLPQALVLTAIVIGFGMIAFVLALVLRARGDLGSDRISEGQGRE